MANLQRAIDYRKEFIGKYPEHKSEVDDLFQLMKDEIDEGGSTEHEIELFIGSCDDLLIEDEH